MTMSDWNKRKRMTNLMSEIGGKRSRTQRVEDRDMTTVADSFECPLSVFQRRQALSPSWSSSLQRLATHPYLGNVGPGDELCGALPFLDSGF